MNYPTWRNNKQYLIEIAGRCTLVLTLERISASVTTPLGLYIFDHKGSLDIIVHYFLELIVADYRTVAASFGGRVLDVSAHRTVYKAFKRSQVGKCA